MAKEATLDLSTCSVAEALTRINKHFGANTAVLGSSIGKQSIVKTSTGILALDIALGGGLPQNRIIEFNGPFSSFKSGASLLSIAAFHRRFDKGLAAYIDVERTFDPIHARRFNVDLSRLWVINPDSGEQAVDAMNAIITMGVPLFVVIDSVAALVPTAEVEESVDRQMMGTQARLINRMMRVLVARMKRNLYDESSPPVTVLALNQIRNKIGVVYGNPETTPGGMGKDFAYSVIVRLSAQHSKAGKVSVTRNGVKRDVQVSQTIGFRVVKNKAGGPQHENGDFIFYERDSGENKAYTINNEWAAWYYGCFYGAITLKPGVGYSYGGIVAKREKDFIAKLRAKKPLYGSLRRDCITAACDLSRFDDDSDTDEEDSDE